MTDYLNRKTKAPVVAYFFNRNMSGRDEEILAFASTWGQLGIDVRKVSKGDTSTWGGWEGVKLITPEGEITESVYIVWNPEELKFDYVDVQEFELNHVALTTQVREFLEKV